MRLCLKLFVILFYESVIALPPVVNSFIAGCTFQDHFGCTLQEACEIQGISPVNASPSMKLHLHPYVVVNPSTNPPTYRLKVNSTWRPHFTDRSKDLLGFQLNVTDKKTNESTCFTIRVENVSSFANGNRASMLFWFWSANLFKYERTYHVQLSSLPASALGSTFVEETMPDHPDALAAINASDLRCLESGHRDAYRWVTAFRLVHKKPWQRAIDVEFVAAPPAYCFEAYELRLIHESKNIVESAVVTADLLMWETVGDRFLAYGNYSFENVEPGNYRIGLIPVDRGHNGVCKCPVPDGSCSCSLAILHNVVMLERTTSAPDDPCDHMLHTVDSARCQRTINSSELAVYVASSDGNALTFRIALLLVTAVLVVLVFTLTVWYLAKKRALLSKGGLRRYILPSATEALARPPKEQLIQGSKEITVLLVYSRDCPLHEGAVQAFASWLRWICPSARIRADFLCRSDILENKCDWVVKSIKEADRIVVINSYGSFMRYRAKLLNEQTVGLIERKSPDEFDYLFLTQIDVIFSQFFANCYRRPTESKLMSIRFSYTPSEWILSPLAAYPCYELPTHCLYFVENLFHPSAKTFAAKQLMEGVFYDQFCRAVDKGLKEFAHSNDWFSRWHCRKRCSPHFASTTLSSAAKEEDAESISLLLSSDSRGTTSKEQVDASARVEKAFCEGPTGDSGFEDEAARSDDRYTSTESSSQNTATGTG